jgi:hypothetical protein
MVFGLLCNAAGCPVGVAVFEGHTGDPTTVSAVLARLRQRFHLHRVVVVGEPEPADRARIREEWQPMAGLDWITALRGPTLHKLVEGSALDSRALPRATSWD